MVKRFLTQRVFMIMMLALLGFAQGFAQTYYSKVTLKLGTVNDLGTVKLGGKVYIGTTAEEAASCVYEYTSECAQAFEATTHVYYLYAQPEEGFELAGWSSSAGASSGFNSTANPYEYKVTSVKSTDVAAPTEKTMYGVFKYKAENKPTTAYTNFSVVGLEQIIDEAGKKVNVPADGAGMVGVTFGENQTSCNWVADNVTSETHSANYESSSLSFPYTIFAKANPGYEFLGFASSSTSISPSNATKGETGYYSSSYTKMSVSSTNLNFPGLAGLPDHPRNKTYYAIFKKLEQMDEPKGETTVEVTDVNGTTELVEGSANKNFSVDLVLNEELPYDVPGSDKNAKPAEILKQFVTVQGANGNKSNVASYSLVYESTDLGQGSQSSGDLSYGTLYSCHAIRLLFPYDIKADTYTVHLPYGLYTTKAGNKTPTYEFTITVTEDTNPYLTIKKQTPREGLTYTYTRVSQTSQDKTDPENGKVDVSNITVEIEFNEIVNSIDQSKASGIALTNTTEGINYRYTSLSLPAQLFGKVDGRTAIAYPELINGSYTMTIPEGLFVGVGGKVNEAIAIHFTVTGFKNATLKPYEMVTDQITPKANAMTEKLVKFEEIKISYKGEFGDAKALIGDASGIKVQRYTEVIQGEGEGAKPVRTYYDVKSTPSVKVENGKLVVNFTPTLYTGMYEVTIPASMAANMDATGMTMAEKVNAGYAETPAYSMTFNVETPNLATATMVVNAEAKWGTFMAPFSVDIPEGVTAYGVSGVEDNTLVLVNPKDEGYDEIPPYSPVLLYAENGFAKTEIQGIERQPGTTTGTVGLLTGTLEPIASVEQGNYLLQNQKGKVGFYKVAQDGLKLGANRCYLTKPATSGDVKAFYMDQETAIKALEALTSGKAEIYDLNGRKLNKMQKGVNIVNGVKVLVK